MQRKNITKLLVKLVLSIGIMAILISRMEFESFDDMIHRFSPAAWVAATALIIAQFMLITVRWQVLANIGRRQMNFRQALDISVASLVANALFIAAITGVVVKIAMAMHYGMTLFKSVLATIVDRLMTLAALLFLSGLFLPLLGKYLESTLYTDVAIGTGAAIFALFVLAPVILTIVVRNLYRLPFSARHLRTGGRYLTLLLRDKMRITKVAGVSLLAQLCFFMAVYCVVQSTGQTVSFIDMMTVLPIITLVASLPISFGGWGVREGAFVYGFGLLNIPMETAFLVSVQVGLIGLLVTALVGIPVLSTTNIRLSRLPKVPNIRRLILQR